MSLNIDYQKCPDANPDNAYAVATAMWVCGVNPIKDEEAADLLYVRYRMILIAQNNLNRVGLLTPEDFHTYIGAHANVPSLTDFQYAKVVARVLKESAEGILAHKKREANV